MDFMFLKLIIASFVSIGELLYLMLFQWWLHVLTCLFYESKLLFYIGMERQCTEFELTLKSAETGAVAAKTLE